MFDPGFRWHSFGFRPRRAVWQAIDQVQRYIAEGARWVLEADIEKCFDMLDRQLLLSFLFEKVHENDVLDLIELILDADVAGAQQGSTMGLKEAPQGSPLSPLLANIYLDYYDKEAAQAGFIDIRYADDFIVLCRSKRDAEAALEKTLEVFDFLKLRLNPEKTGIRHIDTGFTFLGFEFSGEWVRICPKDDRQFECASDQAFRLAFAKAIVGGKIHNMRVVLMRNRRARQLDELNVSISNVRRLGERLVSATDVDALRGLEGAATAAYFAGLRHLFTQDLGFSARVRRPPTDPINAMLSFGYTLLGQAVEMAVLTAGLDPYVGFVHSMHYGRPSLMLDLIEEFRPIVIDSLILRVVNNRWLTKDDFVSTDDAERPVSLSPEALRRFIGYFENTMETPVSHPEVEGKVTYRRCLHLQARQLARYIKGEVDAYRPVTYR